MDISVVIPAHNEERYVGTCVASILRCDPPKPRDIIVVDNASTDRTTDVALAAGARVVREPRQGTNRARQRGLEEAQGEFVAFIDADVMLPKSWFRNAEALFAARPDLVAASGPCIYYDLPPLKRMSVAWWNYLSYIVQFFFGAHVMGGNLIVRRTALLAIGGLDTSRTFYGDDVDTARRLAKAGAFVFHRSLTTRMSGRRLVHRGILRVGFDYARAFLAERLLGRPTRSVPTHFR